MIETVSGSDCVQKFAAFSQNIFLQSEHMRLGDLDTYFGIVTKNVEDHLILS